MKDRLPLLLEAPGPHLASVEEHVAACADCRDELELLRAVRAAVHPAPVDVERVAAAIAPYRRAGAPGAWGSTRLAGMALAATLVLAAGVLAWQASRDDVRPDTVLAMAVPASGVAREVGIGDSFAGLTEADLEALVGEMTELDATTVMDESEVDLPALDRGGEGGEGL